MFIGTQIFHKYFPLHKKYFLFKKCVSAHKYFILHKNNISNIALFKMCLTHKYVPLKYKYFHFRNVQFCISSPAIQNLRPSAASSLVHVGQHIFLNICDAWFFILTNMIEKLQQILLEHLQLGMFMHGRSCNGGALAKWCCCKMLLVQTRRARKLL